MDFASNMTKYKKEMVKLKATRIIKKFFMLSFIVSLFILLSGCGTKKYDFTIKVFEIGKKVELESTNDYYYDYTGREKDFYVYVYRNEERILNTTLDELLNQKGNSSLIYISSVSYFEHFEDTAQKTKKLPLERGFYSYRISFNVSESYDNEPLRNHNLGVFILNVYIDYDYYMEGA